MNSGNESQPEDCSQEDGKKKSKRKKLAEVVYKEAKQITNKKWAETKNPYQQELASRLDSATDVSKLRNSVTQIQCWDAMSIVPNEDVPQIGTNVGYFYRLMRENCIFSFSL